jgi:SAM-dependent methyltransferase
MTLAPFDAPEAIRINRARKAFLNRIVPDLIRHTGIETAIDVGCGFGFFSGCLEEQGLHVTAVDGRSENAKEAARRYPWVDVKVYDVEDPSITTLGRFDLVLSFGLLYHLENPLRALRNIAALTGRVLILETVIAPTTAPAAVLYEEDPGADQGMNYIALIPSEPWLVKCLYCCGLQYVYRSRARPRHEDFHASVIRRRRRTLLVASRSALDLPMLQQVPEPRTSRYLWDWVGTGFLPDGDRLRNIIRDSFRRMAVVQR